MSAHQQFKFDFDAVPETRQVETREGLCSDEYRAEDSDLPEYLFKSDAELAGQKGWSCQQGASCRGTTRG
jgi:hypothetical protein